MTPSIAGRMFLKALFDDHKGKFVNLRAIAADCEAHTTIEEFHSTGDLEVVLARAEELTGTHDVYVGVLPRDHESGRKDAVSSARVLWVDCDSKEASEALADFEVEPSIEVSSGTPGNSHAYWLLDAEVSVDEAERLNHRLALRLGGDVNCRDASRILRVPGTLNHKSDPPNEVILKELSDTLYNPDELEAVLPELEPGKGSKGKPCGKEDRDESPAVARVLGRLENVRKEGAGWKATCPAHADDNPSLSVAEGEDGRCLLYCFAGCGTEDVVSAVGLQMSDLMSDGGDGAPRKRVAVRIVELAFHRGAELFNSPDGDAWISVEIDGRRDTWPVGSHMSEMWLRRAYYEDSGEAAGREALAEAKAQLEAHAHFEGDTREVFVRVSGSEEGPVFLDLGDEDRTVIKIESSGFEIAEGEVPYFRRASSTTGLPIPDPKGSVEELRGFVNVRDEGSWMRLVGFLLMCFHPSGPYPVLSINGEQGSAKTTSSRLILSLVDPHKAGLMSGNPGLKDLAITASSNWLIVLDNVSSIKVALSDALCRVSTGGGLRTRRLYTDSDEIALEYRRPIVINGIGSVIKRPDLLDRTAPVSLKIIAPEDRRTETELMAKWELARPSILGGLLSAVAAAIANQEEVKLEGSPRLADWARWVEAAATYLEWEPGAFTEAIDAGQDEQVELSIDDQIEIRGLIELVEKMGELKLPATELLTRIHEHLKVDTAGRKDLLTRGSDLSRVLNEFAPALRKRGIEVTFGRGGGGTRDRFIHVRKVS